MECKKCGATLSKDDAFCPECGKRVEIEKTQEKKAVVKEKKPIKVSKKEIIISSVIAFVGLVIILVLFVIPFPYSATEVYSVNDPYSDVEYYTEEVPYQDTECDYRNAAHEDEQRSRWEGSLLVVSCGISNFEDEAVQFQYKLYTNDCEHNEVDSYGPNYVTIGPRQTITKEAFLESGGCYGCWATPLDQIKECHMTTKFKNVQKQRTVTKYRSVDRERKVTRYASLFRQMTGHVDWYFREGEA